MTVPVIVSSPETENGILVALEAAMAWTSLAPFFGPIMAVRTLR